MNGRADEILRVLDFHNLEAVGYLMGLTGDTDEIKTKLMQVLGEFDGLATEFNVDSIRDRIQEFETTLLQFLWGVEFDQNGEPIFESVVPISSLARTKLDLQVEHPPQASKQTKRMLVLATEHGRLVDATIQVVAALSDRDFSPTIVDFEATEIVPGLIRLDIPLVGSLRSVKTFLIAAKHSDHEFGNDSHQGTILTTDMP